MTEEPTEHFNAAEFDAGIASHGSPVLWRKARTCPCVRPSGQSDPTCPICLAFGLLWSAGTEIKVLAPGRRRDDRYDIAGSWLEGFVQFSFQTTVTPGHFDRIDSTLGVMVVNNEIHVRGEVNKALQSTERLRLGHAIAVEYCEAIVGGVLTAYTSPADFSINANGDVIWVSGRGPAAGTQYTMRYTARPSWVCWSPRERDEGGNKMPYPVSAQRLDFFRRPAVGEGPVL